MRVTEKRMTENVAASLQKARQAVTKAGDAVSSGVSVKSASDDGVGWAEGMRARVKLAENDAHKSVIARTVERLEAAEGALGTIGNVLLRVVELGVQGANATNAAERAPIGQEVRQLLGAAINAANSKAPDGEYLLSSFNAFVAPFNAATGAYGDGTAVRSVDVGPGLRLGGSIPGSRLTLSPGVNVFTVVGSIATALETNDVNALTAELDRLQTAVSTVAAARGEVGSYSSALGAAEDARFAMMVNLTETHERAVGADFVAAATTLAQAENALQAAQISGQQLLEMASVFGR